MALNIKALRILEPHLRKAQVLCLGYPDLLASPEKIKDIFGVEVTRFTNRGKWHTGKEVPLPETQELFDKLGSTIDCIDIAEDFGIERVVDLNHPHDLGKFDLVIDPGTIEHCFNIGQAIINAANAVKLGGRIFHVPPMTMLNHGFYNLCPTLFHDFYTQNGWRIEYMAAFDSGGGMDISATGRFQGRAEASLYVMAQRTNENALKFPIQTKYLKKMEMTHDQCAA